MLREYASKHSAPEKLWYYKPASNDQSKRTRCCSNIDLDSVPWPISLVCIAFQIRSKFNFILRLIVILIMVLSHYLSPSWFIMNKAHWHWAEEIFIETILDATHYKVLEKYLSINTSKSSRGQWVNTFPNTIDVRKRNICMGQNNVIVMSWNAISI